MSRLLSAALAASCLLAAACAKPPAPPPADFLVSAGDSTYWVRTGGPGPLLRSSPLLLARDERDFYELYTAEDDRSYYDAVLVGELAFRRSLTHGDSLVIFADTLVPRLARHYAAAHPDEYPLDPDDDPSEEPELVASSEIDLLAVHGAYVSYEHRWELGRDGRERYATRRGVIDWRSGRPARLADLFGRDEAARLAALGLAQHRAALDSVRRRRDSVGVAAGAAAGNFRFDPESFTLDDAGDTLLVAFTVPGHGDDAGGLTLSLDALPVVAPPAWWAARDGATRLPGDSVTRRWRLGAAVIEARDADDSSDDERLTLALRDPAGRRAWPIGRVQGPVHAVWALDREHGDALRRAVARAFDESALYGEEARSVARHARPRRPRAAATLAARRAPGRSLAPPSGRS